MSPSAGRHLPVILCFAGQGAQYFHMAADLLAGNATFRHWFDLGARLLRLHAGLDVHAAIHDPARRTGDPFDDLATSHPALFLVQYALGRAVLDRGVRPDLLWGVSLGEMVAMALGGALPFDTALLAVAAQPAQFRACEPGGLLAVLGPPACRETLSAETELAGTSAPNHCVLAAPAAALAVAEAELRRRDIVVQRLPVPHAFHSRWVDAGGPACRAATASLGFTAPTIPCFSSATAASVDVTRPDLVWRIVRDPMRIHDCIQGFERAGGATYVDCSPSGTLAALVRLNLAPPSPSRLVPLVSPFGGNLARLEGLKV